MSAVPPDPSSPDMFLDIERMLEWLDALSVDIIGTYPVQMADPLWRIFVRIMLYFKDTQDIITFPSDRNNKLPIRLGQAIAAAHVQWNCDECRRDEVDLFLQRAQAAYQNCADMEDQQLDMSPARSREEQDPEQAAGSRPGPTTPLPEIPIDQAERRPSDMSIAFHDTWPPAVVSSVRTEPYARAENTEITADAVAQAINNTSARSRFDD
jgi:hypothetical protein